MCPCLHQYIANVAVVARTFNTSLCFGRVMKIELAVLSFLMSLLSICDQQMQSTLANLHSHTVKNLLQDQRFLQCCEIKLCKHKEIFSVFYSALRAPTALVIGVCFSRMPNIFSEDEFLSFDFAINTLVNQINSFYFYAIKRIMQ